MKVKIYKYIIRLFTVSLVSIMVLNIISLEVVKAAPFSGVRQTITQPNGDVIECYTSGDEFFSYLHDSDGNIIVQNTQGQYVYAKLENNIMVPSDNVVLPSGIVICDKIKITDVPESYIKMMREASPFYKQPEAELASSNDEYKLNPFINETLNNIVIFIDFLDLKFKDDIPVSYYNDIFNGDGYSLKNWFETASFGKSSIDTVMLPNSNNSFISAYHDNHYQNDYKVGNWYTAETSLFQRAIETVITQIPQDLDVDKNNDGYVDLITFVVPGERIDYFWLFHPHASGMKIKNVTINGKVVDSYNTQVENILLDQTNNVGTLAHETFHLYGAPDLYTIGSVGHWDVMNSISNQLTNSYMKCRYGNLMYNIPEIKKDGNYFLFDARVENNNCYIIRSPFSDEEFYVLEYRRKQGMFDGMVPGGVPGSGLVIYRVNLLTGGMFTILPDTGESYFPHSGTSVSLELGDGRSSGININNIKLTEDRVNFSVHITDERNALYFKDIRVAQKISRILGKSIENITEQDLAQITELTIDPIMQYDLPIDLEGIENLTNLQKLTLECCQIDDISYLSNLINLTELRLIDNNIKCIEALQNLCSLKTLTLRGNLISDYSPVSNYYDNLIVKDFSLKGKDDIYLRVPNDYGNRTIGNVYIEKTATAPSKVYLVAERYNSNGNLIKRARIDNIELNNNTEISIPEFINYSNDSYVVISCYERFDYRTLLSRVVVKSNSFDFTTIK